MLDTYKTFNPFCLFCCCPSAPLHVTARIPVAGYTAGQTIDVEINVENKSNQNCIFRVELAKRIEYHSNDGKTIQETKIIGKNGQVGISQGDTVSSFRTSLLIPPTPPTDVTISKVCKMRYVLQVSIIFEIFRMIVIPFSLPLENSFSLINRLLVRQVVVTMI